ncbi:MAG: nuclear transport factor 2 family protein [Gemmatimonadales bacterium]
MTIRTRSLPIVVLVCAVVWARQVVAQAPTDSSSVAATVHHFHQALVEGDSAAMLALLAPDVTIMESGDIETRAHYRAHHLPADIAFARAVPAKTGAITVMLQGNVAWAMSTSRATGQFEGRAIDSDGAELLVLSRGAAGWRIRAIHWSSRSRHRGE